MTDKDLDDFRRKLFGEESAPMPQAYLASLKHLTAQAATPPLGLEENSTSRIAYWVDGRTLGALSCEGSSDEDGKINGRIVHSTRQ